jgi:hypothetical protein
MFEHHVEGRTDLRHPKFLDMFAPQFLVNELLAAGQWRRSDFPDESSYNLYLRLRTGGKVTVYTLKRLCAILGVTLPSPIYGHKKLMGKVEKDQEEVTYTLSVQDPLHRFEADGVITKNSGADIMKIALVLCHKEWHKRGWLKNGGDDSVRMLLTVHDEIVFEIRNDRIEEALPLICQIMSSPWKFPGPPFSPRWQVPLIVEPLLGLSWGGVYNWDMMTEGKKQPPKEGEKLEPHEIRVGDKVYHRVPPWLEGHVKPGWERHGHEAVPTPTTTSSQAPAAVPVEAATPAAAASKTARAPVTPQISDTPAPRPSSPPAAGKVTTFAINKLSKHTVHIISVLCMKARDVDRGTVLRLVDPSGSILVDPAMGIRINPEKFKEYILEHTLGDGSYFID